MDFEFSSSVLKFEKNAKDRRQQKQEHRLIAHEREQNRVRMELELNKKRELLMEQKLKQDRENEKNRNIELKLTGGIDFHVKLKPFYLPDIESDDDKITLPETCLVELMNKSALPGDTGRALCFRLSVTIANKQIITHCGVREFTAKEGFIGVNRTVSANLNIKEGDDCDISIKYVVLPKVTKLTFQPLEHKFYANIGPVKRCLEENLLKYTTISIGNEIGIWFRGERYTLKVSEVVTEADVSKNPLDHEEEDKIEYFGGTLIDTSIEVQFVESAEYLAQESCKHSAVPVTANTEIIKEPFVADKETLRMKRLAALAR